ncbi:hypothetical protein KCU67_g2438, partial [Aureobasidium melanogenum]
MARPSGTAHPAGAGKTATGVGGKGLGKNLSQQDLARQHQGHHEGKHSVSNSAARTREFVDKIYNRLARRGGVKRISATIYDEVRFALKDRLKTLLQDICAILECTARKTVTVPDVVFVLNRHGTPIYGFDAPFRTRR